MLPISQEMPKDLDLWSIGRAYQSSVVGAARDFLNTLVRCIRMYRIDCPDGLGSRDRKTLLALDAQAHNYDSQVTVAPSDKAGTGCISVCCSRRSSRLSTSSGSMGLLPSRSHAIAAATEPRMDAITGFLVAAKANVE